MTTPQLFEKAKKNFSLNEIAEQLHLHVGTVKRWEQLKRVPESYRANFLRILGMNEMKPQTEKDKDQFYTKPEVAEKCFKTFKDVMKKLDIDVSKYHFIEPSAGCGCFYQILPKGRKTGIDIDPRTKGIIKSDYLNWKPKKNMKSIVIGNPPFGLRGNLALQFINHSYNFADVVAFILPQLFESDGKGSTKKRVKGYELAHSSKIPANSFYYPDGTEISINTIFQVWVRVNTDKIQKPKKKTCDEYIRVYSLSDGGTPASTRNKKMIGKCDLYIPSTTFQEVKAFDGFKDLPHKRGYGVVIKKNKRAIKKLLKNHDWRKTAFRSTNNALNLRTSLIQDVVIGGKYYDRNR